MQKPARAGLFLYASDMARLARFYEAIVGLRQLHEEAEMIVLHSPDLQLVVHQIPSHIADGIVIESPPVRREDSAMKFFFTVPNISEARTLAPQLGGDVGHENWAGPGFVVCNATDPEGNVFQLREIAP